MSIQDLKASDLIRQIYAEFGEDDMPESGPQSETIHYLVSVLAWLFRLEDWYVISNLLVVQPGYSKVVPDVAVYPVVLSQAERDELTSWQMDQPDRPAPRVVFEISSDGTWENDLSEKIARYQQLGTLEYFAFDPKRSQVWRDKSTRLLGWRYAKGEVQEIKADGRGWLWSEALDSWLTSAGTRLRLYDRAGNQRFDGEEAEREAKEAEQEAKEKAWTKLRELGIDPESL